MAERVKLIIAYLGAPFCGWQRQSNGRTVQGELERAVAAVTGGLEVAVIGAGRTDAGVHAAGQVAHADLPTTIPAAALVRALNGALPDEIRVRAARRCSAGFHARVSARAKLYSYRARWAKRDLPWLDLRCARLRPIVLWSAFEQALELFPGRHDVASFTVRAGDREDSRRTLFRVWSRQRPDGVDLHFVGDGFLRYQVRRMVGALFQVGWGQLGVHQVEELLRRPSAGSPILTAPARGLTLERVFYRFSRLLDASAAPPVAAP